MDKEAKNRIIEDCFRITGNRKKVRKVFWRDKVFRQVFFFRKYHGTEKRIPKYCYRIMLHFASKRTGVEIPKTVELGGGVLFVHPYGITINSKAVIGKNLTMLKGATIGHIKEGKRKGAPVIGNNVYIGLNSTVVGGIRVGDNVVIAPNAFVNFDVPDYSIVVGNPGVIHKRENAIEGYIVNPV